MTTTEKTCVECKKTLPMEAFYLQKKMADGHMNQCKDCKKAYEKARRNGPSREKILAYDKARASMPHRIEARESYQKTIAFAESHQKACRKYKELTPDRRAAQLAVGRAIRSGRLHPLPCFCCGKKSEAHHPDYSSPLDVVWLCPTHHKQAHAIAKETNHTQRPLTPGVFTGDNHDCVIHPGARASRSRRQTP